MVETLTSSGKRRAVALDVAQAIDEEVDSKSGLGGLALKGAYKIARASSRDFVPDTVERLLPEFAAKLEPIVEEHRRTTPDVPLQVYFASRAGDVADALLSLTDEKARRSSAGTIRSAYEKMRPAARRHVEEAAPRIGGLLARHLP
ncbi:MAG TPA: hypothetical protein VN033_06570 [Vulgatibacter sp.]|nr:hypothetical protein [Vulgatibacter sp.]